MFAALALSLPWLGKAYHNDEPFFLKAGKQILSHPLDPLGFTFTWYGSPQPAARINTTPPVLLYSAAAAQAIGGEREWLVRLLLLPYDLVAALFLYLIAARFLRRPLLPTLLILAGPAWVLDMGLVMAEKPAMAFGLAGVYCAVRGVDEESDRLFYGGAGLLALALLSKYIALVFLPPVVAYAWSRRRALAGIGVFLAGAVAPVGATALYSAVFNPEVIRRAVEVTGDAGSAWWSAPSHKLRSFLAFTGGLSFVGLFWAPLLAKRRHWLVYLGLAALLYSPLFDLPFSPGSRLIDRMTGVVLAAAALASFRVLAAPDTRKLPGWPLWASWVAAGAVLQMGLYWSVMARIVLFLVPPLVFALAERLEDELPDGLALARAGALLAALALGLSLSYVDYRYAAAQKEFALELSDRFLDKGRTVWHSSYMGLAHYLDARGAKGLDALKGGWDLARPGDVVAVADINCALRKPAAEREALVETIRVEEALPIRVISGFTGEAGFYSNVSGWLPFSFSREPLEVFRSVEVK